MPKNSNFMELKDQDPHQSQQTQIRQPPSTTSDQDDDNLSLASEDIDIEGGSGSNKKKSVKQYISEKKADFNAKEFVETKKHQIQTFSLDEFMSDKRKILIKAVAGEFLVTTLFLWIVCAVGLNITRAGHADSEMVVGGALTTAFGAIALIYSFADVSGAHFNPAVTFATIVTGKTSLAKGLVYMAAQLCASLFAMGLLYLAFPEPLPGLSVSQALVVVPPDNVGWFRVFVMEFILTFILAYVIFAVAFDTVNNNATVKVVDEKGQAVSSARKAKNLTIYTASGNTKAGFAPLAIGLTLGFLVFLGGSVSGGAFNPARVFMAALVSGNFKASLAWIWVYFVADFLGAASAGLIQQNFFATKQDEEKK